MDNLFNVAYDQKIAIAALEDAPEGTVAVIDGDGVRVISPSKKVLENAYSNMSKADKKLSEQLAKDPVGTVLDLLLPE